MLQRLPIAFAKVKVDNTSENLLNEISQIIHFLHRAKEITKKVHNNIMSTIKLQNIMDTILTNSKNSKTSDPHKLWLNLSEKIDLLRSNKYVALSNLSIYDTWKNTKKSYKNNNFKISAPTWNEGFEFSDGSFSASDIQDFFKYISKIMGGLPIVLQ